MDRNNCLNILRIGYYNVHYRYFINLMDIIISVFIMTPQEMAEHMARQVQAKRLALNLSQQTLAERSGVSYGVLKKFERSGQISLKSLLKLALTLGTMEEFKDLFSYKPGVSLDELMKDKSRKRGRQ